MRTFFVPAIALMNRLPHGARFFLLGVVGFIAIAASLAQLLFNLSAAIAVVQGEIEGIQTVKPLQKLIQAAQQHRGLSSGAINGDRSLAEKRMAKEKEVADAFAAVAATLPPTLARAPEWKAAKDDWEQLRRGGLTLPAPENFDRHTMVIRRLLDFLARVGEESRLVLDPDFAASFMIGMVIQRMPETLEPLGQMRARGTGILAKKEITEPQRVEINRLVSEVGLGVRGLNVAATKAAGYAPHLNETLNRPVAAFGRSFEDVNRLIHNDILTGTFATLPSVYFEKTTAVIDIGYRQLYETLLPALDDKLNGRLGALQRNLAVNLAVSLLLLLAVAYLAVGAYYAVAEEAR